MGEIWFGQCDVISGWILACDTAKWRQGQGLLGYAEKNRVSHIVFWPFGQKTFFHQQFSTRLYYCACSYCDQIQLLWPHAVTVTACSYCDQIRLLWPIMVTVTACCYYNLYGYCNLLYIILCVSVTGSGYNDLLRLLWTHAVTVTHYDAILRGYCNLLRLL